MYSMTQRFHIHALKMLVLLETWIMTKSLHHYIRQGKPSLLPNTYTIGYELKHNAGLICTKKLSTLLLMVVISPKKLSRSQCQFYIIVKLEATLLCDNLIFKAFQVRQSVTK